MKIKDVGKHVTT